MFNILGYRKYRKTQNGGYELEGKYTWFSYADVNQLVSDFAAGLRQIGIQPVSFFNRVDHFFFGFKRVTELVLWHQQD